MMARIYLILLGQAFLTLWTCWADGPSVRIDNLLHVKWNLTVGLFKTDQRLVESFLARRFEDEDNELSIAASHTSRYPDMPGEHEVVVIHGYDASELSETWETDTRDKMSTNFEFVFMGIPDLRSVTGSSSQSIALLVQLFTNSRRPVYFPFFTDQVTYVDALSTQSDGTVDVRKDGDELILRLNDVGTGCPQDSCVKEDDYRALRDSLWVTYPHPFTFDWSICEQIWSPNICQVIDSAVSSSPKDFCVSFHKIDPPRRCGTSMEIMKMTGIFREASLLTDQPPIKSFEAERVEMPSHYHGLVAPCL